jgi:hypothetical protein
MLITNHCDDVTSRRYLLDAGQRAWRAVHLELAEPYFLVRYETQEKDYWIGQTAVFSAKEDLFGFCNDVKEKKSERILQVALLSPSWMNNESGWQLNNITEIRIWDSPREQREVGIYVTAEGKHYTAAPVDVSEETLRKSRMVFSFAPGAPAK